MEWLELGLLRMPASQDYRARTGGKELLLVVQGGMVHLEVKGQRWEFLGQRQDVFDGPATAAYIPPGYSFKAHLGRRERGGLCLGHRRGKRGGRTLCHPSPRGGDQPKGRCRISAGDPLPSFLSSGLPAGSSRGRHFSPEANGRATPPTNTTGKGRPRNAAWRRYIFYRIDPPRGFGLQRIYSPDGGLDEPLVLKDRMAVGIRSGYHPVVSAPGYRLYYLWFLAGESRELIAYDDPDHAWVASGETR
jgi:5-deoxy-glucuronate isomerase